jgi:RNA polymerase sigma factor (TIGR02999 family)
MSGPSPDLTAALAALARDPAQRDAVLSAVYEELLRIARAELAGRRRGATLDTRSLVNEAYLKLFGGDVRNYVDRKHFYATAAQAMRHVAIDHARAHLRECRGAGAVHVSLDVLEGQPLAVASQAEELLAIDGALTRLAELDPRLAQVLELRFFSGMEVVEIAELLGISEATVKRDTRTAKAFLEKELVGG